MKTETTASSGPLDGSTHVIPIGPEVPWTETAQAIGDALKNADNDLDGWVILMRTMAVIYRLRSPAPDVEGLLDHVREVYKRVNVAHHPSQGSS
jgi:hypothetical protein